MAGKKRKGKKHGKKKHSSVSLPKDVRKAASKIRKHVVKLEREEAKQLSAVHKLQSQIKELKSLT